jgi:competence ComEA-like helix-hairpin-helix protein
MIQDTKQTNQERIQAFAFVISVCLAACLALGFVRHARGGQAAPLRNQIQLDNRINPNLATAASLTRLAGLGPGRAGAIVAYRENFGREGKRPAFRNCDDLQNVRGIGPKTVQSISEWLKFD